MGIFSENGNKFYATEIFETSSKKFLHTITD